MARRRTDDALTAISDRIAVVTAENGVNLRKGPGTIFESIGSAEWQQRVAIIPLPYGTEVPGYVLAHTGEIVGWINELFLREVE